MSTSLPNGGDEPSRRRTGGARNTGAYRVAEDPNRKRRPLWLLALLGLLLLALLLFLLSRCGNEDPVATAPTVPPATATPTASAPASASSPPSPTVATATASASVGGPVAPVPTGTTSADASSPGTGSGSPGTATGTGSPSGSPGSGGAGAPLTAGNTALLPLRAAAGPGGSLAQYVGRPATSRGVTVQSVPADEGFWAGTSATDRVWVQLTGQAGESAYQVQQGDRVDFTGRVVAHGSGYPTQAGVEAAEGARQLAAQRAHIEAPKNGVRLSAG